MTTDSQNKRILAQMKKGHAVTPLTALRDFGCFRLSARMWDLRKAGHNIKSALMTVSGGKRVAMYWIGSKR